MRRALGLNGDPGQAQKPSAPLGVSNGPQAQRRRFVRDGEVPVTLVHRSHGPDDHATSNQLDATRQALQVQNAAREKVERALAEAQAVARDLETKLAHERLAKGEVEQRAASQRHAIEQALAEAQEQLAAERAARLAAERERDQAVFEVQELEQRLRKAPAVEPAMLPVMQPDDDDAPPKQPRRRGRPPKIREEAQPTSDIVEWWVPGWQEKYRIRE